jgi:hypothetical protein
VGYRQQIGNLLHMQLLIRHSDDQAHLNLIYN